MRRGFLGCCLLFIATPAALDQTFLDRRQGQIAKILAMDQNEVVKLLNSDPPEFCTIVPAVSATMLVGGQDLWNWSKMPLDQKIHFEQAYAASLRKVQACLYDSVQKNDEQGIESGFFALALLEARYLDLRASLMSDAAVRIEQLSGAVNAMQNLLVAMNQNKGNQNQARLAQALGAALRGLGNWAQYRQQLNLYHTVTVNENRPRGTMDVFGMMRNIENDIQKASHPLGLNCTSVILPSGVVKTVCP